MGVLEARDLDSLTTEEEGWRKGLVDGTPNGRIPEGESMVDVALRMHGVLERCLALPAGSRPLLVSHGMALGCLLSTVLGLSRRLSAACVCATVPCHALIISKARGWHRVGW